MTWELTVYLTLVYVITRFKLHFSDLIFVAKPKYLKYTSVPLGSKLSPLISCGWR